MHDVVCEMRFSDTPVRVFLCHPPHSGTIQWQCSTPDTSIRTHVSKQQEDFVLCRTVMHGRRQRGDMGGSCPLCPMPYPTAAPPVDVRKNYMGPLDPSRLLSQRKFYVKIHEMCQNTAQ